MLITFSLRILARFQTGSPDIMAAGNFASRPDPSKIFSTRNFVSRRETRQDSHQESGYPPRIPARLRPGSRRDFGRRESGFPPRIPARFQPGPCRDFGRRESHLPPRIWARRPPGILSPAKNAGKIPVGILPRFWPPAIPLPAKNPGGNRDFAPPKSRQDPGGILVGILARSRQDPGAIFTREVYKMLCLCLPQEWGFYSNR